MRARRKQQLLNKAFARSITRLTDLLESGNPEVVLRAVQQLLRLQAKLAQDARPASARVEVGKEPFDDGDRPFVL
jgi:uncharacterized membrane protein YccC